MLTLAAEPAQSLSLADARARALKSHPKISVADLRALAARQTVREAKAAYLPYVSANAAAVGAADDNTRIASSGLSVSSVQDRASVGASVVQLITDFGRTANLSKSAELRAQAESRNVQATRAQILLEVDSVYYGALQAQALLRVGEQTVKTRELLRDQVRALATNQLRSDLDVSFAEVSLEEARLLVTRWQNDLEASFAALSAVLGSREAERFILMETNAPAPRATESTVLVLAALRDRPELQRLRLERDAAFRFAKAEKGLVYPTLSVQGAAGINPAHDPLLNRDYAAAGIVLNVPLFAGGLYSARRQESQLRAEALEGAVRDEENNVIRDVRVACLNLANARERMTITQRLLEQAGQSLKLATARFQAGSSSMVELSQAELNQISAAIGETSARYEYFLRGSILDFQVGALDKAPSAP